VATPVSYLNAAIADVFEEATNRLQSLVASRGNRDEAIMELVKELVIETKAIRFEGNNYSAEWRAEAEKRGLPILPSSVDAIAVWKNKQATAHLVKLGVLSAPEIESRYNVAVERYVKTLLIELETMLEMTQTLIIPAIESQVLRSHQTLSHAEVDSFKKCQKERVVRLESVFENILEGAQDLEAVLEKASGIHDEAEKMSFIKNSAIPIGDSLRASVDIAERVVSDRSWPLPKYREMLFTNDL
jgi:glutamine synthetase